jgi:hypothetical protein
MKNDMYVEVAEMAPSNEVVSKTSRIQTLNIIKATLEDLLTQTTDKNIENIIYAHLLALEDCYKIDMYKFQFKALADMMQKDIKNIKEAIALEIV